MSAGIIILIVVLVLLAMIIGWVISVQRNLVGLDELCKNAMSQIGVQQNSRWDALGALADMVKQYDDHEYNTLKDIIAQRTNIGTNSTAAEAEADENLITKAMSRFLAVAEAYPDLKANTNYQNLMDSIKQYEENVRLARMSYNDTVTKYNRTIRMFPTSLIAGLLRFVERDYLETPDEKQAMPDLKR